jgi:hypothetical protein
MHRVAKLQHFTPALALLCLLARCLGQGTVIVTFEGPAYPGAPQPQPAGTYSYMEQYSELGVLFTVPHHPSSLMLVGSGLAGVPDDGSAYLGTLLNTTVEVNSLSGVSFALGAF